jgi:spore coat polysaccharide biosynthesis protein SpsF
MADQKELDLLKNKDCAVIIQGRMSSNRFPGKMLSLLAGLPLVEYIYRRCAQPRIRQVLVATSVHGSDDALYGFCREKEIPVFRGALDDVLQRYIDAARTLGARYVVRVCGDTPLVDIQLLEQLLATLIREGRDYVSCDRRTCPAGFYSEAISLHALERARSLSSSPEDLEHVTKFVIDHPEIFSVKFVDPGLMSEPLRQVRLTIDYPQDIVFVDQVLGYLANKQVFSSREVMEAVGKVKA